MTTKLRGGFPSSTLAAVPIPARFSEMSPAGARNAALRQRASTALLNINSIRDALNNYLGSKHPSAAARLSYYVDLVERMVSDSQGMESGDAPTKRIMDLRALLDSTCGVTDALDTLDLQPTTELPRVSPAMLSECQDPSPLLAQLALSVDPMGLGRITETAWKRVVQAYRRAPPAPRKQGMRKRGKADRDDVLHAFCREFGFTDAATPKAMNDAVTRRQREWRKEKAIMR